LLWGFERNINDHSKAAVLNGRRIVFALICRPVWEAIARSARPPEGPATAQFRQLFKGASVPEEIYRGNLTKVARHLRELSAVNNFLVDRGLAWGPPEDPGQ